MKYNATIKKSGKVVFTASSNDLHVIKDEVWEWIITLGIKDSVETKLRTTGRPSLFRARNGDDSYVLRVNFSIR